MFSHFFFLVPPEIISRGPLHLAAYNKALEEGETRVMRLPVMLIGQARSGKTSLRKSLKKEKFDEEEPSTDGIELLLQCDKGDYGFRGNRRGAGC